MIRLLLLTCGTNANYHISKTLKEKYGNAFYIVGTDINKKWEIPTSPYLDAFYQSPLTEAEGYYQYILDICRNEKIDFLLPSFDADQQLFYDGNSDLESLKVLSLGISKHLKDVYKTKVSMNAFLSEHHLPIPQIYRKEEVNESTQYFVKPQNGVGSVGIKVMYGKEVISSDDKVIIIEELCSEPEVTLECFYFQGKVFSVARQRLAQKSGVCTKARIYDDKKLNAIAQKFAESANPPHIFNLQFMINSKGEHVITDVNLRTAGGMSLSYAAGWDEVSALANIMLGKENVDVVQHIQPLRQEQYVMRAYCDIVTKKVREKIAFDFDGTLLDSRKRHEEVMRDVLAEFNIKLSTEGLVLYKADGHNNIAWLKEHGVDEPTAKAIQKRWIEIIENPYYLEHDELYKYAEYELKRLSAENDLFLVTARNNYEGTMAQIKRLGLEQYFNDICIVKSDDSTPSAKSDFLLSKGVDVMIGDTESDLESAKLAGCRFKAVKWGFRSEEFWKQYNVESYKFL